MSGLVRALAAAALVLSLLGGRAGAQQEELTPGEARLEAGRRFQEGMRLFDRRAWTEALVEFDAAYELSPDYRVLLMTAQCHEELGHPAEAAQALERYLVDGGSALEAGEKRSAERALGRLLPRVHALTVRVPIEGAEIVVDRRAIGRAPLRWRVLLAPGPHRIEARLAEHRSAPVDFGAVEGGSSQADLPIRPLAREATLVVDSDPPGLALRIDGREIGRTPYRATVASGGHRIEVRRAGYPPLERVVDLSPESERRVTFGYQGVAMPAHLRLVATSPGTALSIDDGPWQRLGRAATRLELEGGRHRFAVRGALGRSAVRQFEVYPGDRFLLRASPGVDRAGLPAFVKWGALAAAGVLLAGAAATGLLALSEQSSFDSTAAAIEQGRWSSRTELERMQSDALDSKESGESWALTSDILLVAGGVATTATIAAFVLGSAEHEPPKIEVRADR
ncbi:MAG: PEGA domain-containing protein [Deltaproteobacteria bacterium]|nr:PEGA domain-containing protein [Deltaproteobacteria bacterium]